MCVCGGVCVTLSPKQPRINDRRNQTGAWFQPFLPGLFTYFQIYMYIYLYFSILLTLNSSLIFRNNSAPLSVHTRLPPDVHVGSDVRLFKMSAACRFNWRPK